MLEVVSPVKRPESTKTTKANRSSEEAPQKLHLHARELALRHPTSNKLLHFTAPLPLHFQNTIKGFGLEMDKSSTESQFSTLDAAERRLEEKKPSWLGDQRADSEKVKKRVRAKLSSTRDKILKAKQDKRNFVKVIGKSTSTFSRALRRAR
jgi:hypothetical protein